MPGDQRRRRGGGRVGYSEPNLLHQACRAAREGVDIEGVARYAGAEAYRAGAVKLSDYVGQKQSKEWGSTRYAKSLRDIVGDDGAKRWIRAARDARRAEEKLIAGVRVSPERRSHWRQRHPEVTEAIERQVLQRAIESPAHETRDPKDASVVRRYAQDDDGRWWRVAIKTGVSRGDYVLTFHRVQRPGR